MTGGTSGIGATIACALAKNSARAFVAVRTASTDGAFDNTNAQFVACEVTKEATVKSLVRVVQTRATQGCDSEQ